MGCGLNKLEKRDDKRPGNIYSTLKRPQVETKIDVFYEYHFLEFTTLSDVELPGSSAIRLSSLHDLPAQLQEFYQQGFILAALHPFVQPADENEKSPQEQIFRAVLIKKTERCQEFKERQMFLHVSSHFIRGGLHNCSSFLLKKKREGYLQYPHSLASSMNSVAGNI